jgi:LmbE family N-acetylglucosaminyl deacetylase
MKFLEFDRVLCLSPHPDDVEYSMAGTIIKCNNTKFDVLCLTQGGDCDDTTSHNRLNEVSASWKSAKINNVSLFFSPSRFLKELGDDEWINYIESNYLNKNNYDCICTPSSQDSHFEHRIVCNFGMPLTRVKSISLVEYYSPSTLHSWVPNTFIDVSKQYELKLEMLKKFESQQHRSYFNENTIRGFHTNFQCSKKGTQLVEQFNLKQLFIK